jgi:ATPase subunit of ABC transporter with duplicated ATPase domains
LNDICEIKNYEVMTTQSITFRNVSFSFEAMSDWLFNGLHLHFPAGWTGIVGANGAGKTTLVRLAIGELTPQTGTVETISDVQYCQQRTDDIPRGLYELLESTDAEACRIRGRLGLQNDWPSRWSSLSHGERKRSQIAVALWREPSVLAVDEPTNHLDNDARKMLKQALEEFKGIGLLISHDRELLDGLCRQCVFIDPPGAIVRPGNYTEAAAQAKIEIQSVKRERKDLKKEFVRIKLVADRRRDKAACADRKRSKKRLDPKDSDGRDRIDRARVSGKDAVAGKLLRQMEGRVRQVEERLQEVEVAKEYRLGIWMEGECSKRNTLFFCPEAQIPLGKDRYLSHPDLVMKPSDRIALTGPNGAGKSTLIRRIINNLDLPPSRLVYVPQEIDRQTSLAVMDQLKTLSHEEMGRLLTVVSRLGSRPERLLESREPSPGEVRKLLLAFGIVKRPHLIIMDEPTNHMDLPSIECLENALADCPCGLLLVSHDLHFLQSLAEIRWDIKMNDTGEYIMKQRLFEQANVNY